MARALAVLLLTMVTGTSLLFAQTSSETRKPEPAQEKLNYFAGTWTLELHIKNSPLGSRIFFATEHNEWMPKSSLLLSRQEGDGTVPSGGLTVLAYNAEAKTYTYHVVTSTGEVQDLRGTLDGNTWSWTNDATASGSNAQKVRLIITELSSKSYGLKFETSTSGYDWFTVIEGEAHRAPGYPRQDVAFRR